MTSICLSMYDIYNKLKNSKWWFLIQLKKFTFLKIKKFRIIEEQHFKQIPFFSWSISFKKYPLLLVQVGIFLQNLSVKRTITLADQRSYLVQWLLKDQHRAGGPEDHHWLGGEQTKQDATEWGAQNGLCHSHVLFGLLTYKTDIAHTQPTHYINTVHAQVYIYMISHFNTITGKITNKKYLVYS